MERRLGVIHPPEKVKYLPDGSRWGSSAWVEWVERPYSARPKVVRVDGEELSMHLSIGELDSLVTAGLYFLDQAEKEGDARKLGILYFPATRWRPPVVCGTCGLKFVEREQGKCPRCGREVS